MEPLPHPSPHYLRSITSVGERKRVVAHRDIFNERGVKLAAAGLRIDRRIYDRLVNQKLIPSLEEALAVEDAVDAMAVAEEVRAALERSPSLAAVTASLHHGIAGSVARAVQLSPPTAFKLTIAREEMPHLWRHSVLVALLCHYLGWRLQLPDEMLRDLSTAGLLHDIGILHIDPRLFSGGGQFGEEERHQLYSHPIIAHLIIARLREYPAAVAEAVLEHHERLDGSGYPRALPGRQVSRLGRIVAAAEIIASRFDREGRLHGGRRLDMMLKMYSRKICSEVLMIISPLTAQDDIDGSLHEKGEEPIELIEGWLFVFKRLIEEWQEVREALDGVALEPSEKGLLEFAANQMEGLHYDLRRAGFSTEAWAWIAAGAEEDPGHMEEVRALVHETRWRLAEIHHEAHRRWPIPFERQAAPLDPLLRWLAEAAVVARQSYGNGG